MDFQMPLLPTVENTQPKGQKLANELENELDVRSVHLKIAEDNFKFRIYQSHHFISSSSSCLVYSLKNNKIQKIDFKENRVIYMYTTELIMTCELAVGSSSISSRTLCWKKRDFGWQLDVYGWKFCLPHHRRWLFPITETLSTYWHCFPLAAISFAAAFVLSPVDL
ncbi:hypothetical protein T01_2526 [Trichinella spiralis]|uniref:Uncharacterized protein n=1 Tax=Trichinella spiralis TaxID=6334 RepID=A0A0V1BU66_TRISP|nr:hypothetical protein T01_2526 [Trichinella spiralis]